MKLSKRYDSEYTEWLNELKSKIQSTQIKAALSANKEMILLYWKFGALKCQTHHIQNVMVNC